MWQWQRMWEVHPSFPPGLQTQFGHLAPETRKFKLDFNNTLHCLILKETHCTYVLKTAACAAVFLQSMEETCCFFSKGCWALCYEEKTKQPYSKSKWLELVISVLQRKWQLGDRCVNSSAILLNNQSTHRFESVLGNPSATHLLEGNDHTKPIISSWALKSWGFFPCLFLQRNWKVWRLKS